MKREGEKDKSERVKSRKKEQRERKTKREKKVSSPVPTLYKYSHITQFVLHKRIKEQKD